MSIEILRALLVNAINNNQYELITLLEMELLEREFIENQMRFQKEIRN